MRRRRNRIAKWTWLRRTTACVFLALIVLGCFQWFPWFKGSTTATRLFSLIPLADPLAAIEITFASRQLHPRLLIGAGLLLGFCLLMGPVFCGWVCPLGLLLDLNHALRERVRRLFGERRRPPVSGRIPSSIRFGVLGLVLAISLTTRMPAFQSLSPINIIGWSALEITQAARRIDAVSIASVASSYWTVLGPAALLLLAIVLTEFVSPRIWCRGFCPLGACYALVGRFAPLRVRIDPGEAGKTRCEHCERHCPMGIRVMEDYEFAGKDSIDHPDCTRCGACVDSCPRGVLKLGFTPFSSRDQCDEEIRADSSL